MTPRPLVLPATVGRWRLTAELGRGGMGAVYLGTDREGRTAAVKVFGAPLAGDPQAAVRIRREVEHLRSLRVPCVVRMLDADVAADPAWLAMEHVVGRTLLQQVSDGGPLDETAWRALAGALLRAVADLHAAGVVHRDITPGNVMLTTTGPKLIDFGLASTVGATRITREGLAVGTLGYLAPEVIRGERAGEAADVFAVGAVLALAATGQPPFGVDSEKVVLQRVLGGLVDTRGLSADQARLVLSLTASDAADRPTAAHAAGGSAGHSGPASTHLTLAHWALATRNLELPVAQTTLAPVPAPRAVVSGRRRWWRGLPYLMIPAAALLWLTTSPDLAASSTAPSSIAPSASSTSPASSPSSVRPTASASRTSQPESTPAVPDAATGSASSTTSTGIAPPAAPVTQPAVPTARPAPTTQTPAPPTQADSLATTYPFEGGSVKVLGVTPSAGDGGTGRITVEITATERYTGAYALMVSLRGPDSAFAHYFHCLYMGAGTTVVEDVETADFGGTRWNTIVVERQISTSCGKDVAPTY